MKPFEKIKEHLNRKRVDKVVIEKETASKIEFSVSNKYFEKWFYVVFVDDSNNDSFTESLRKSRPNYHHYWMSFNQENYPTQGRLVTIADMRWFTDENDVIDELKRLCRNWRR